jgi:dTDP-4-dehydrorhamnose 3,5-epimerase-like enzyme
MGGLWVLPRAESRAIFSDNRGIVVEPLDAIELAVQRNAHLVVTEPYNIRGNHYHDAGTETALVIGPALVRLRRGDLSTDHAVPAGAAHRFVIPPGVSHAFGAVGPERMLMMVFNTEARNPVSPDTKPHSILEPQELRTGQ